MDATVEPTEIEKEPLEKRFVLARILMVLFSVTATIGAAMIFVPAGFIVFGLSCLLVSLLIGNN